MTRLRWTPQWQQATRALLKLDPTVAKRVIAAVDHFAETGEGDVKKILGVTPKQSRLRVGDWRVVFMLEQRTRFMIILQVGHRRDIYKR